MIETARLRLRPWRADAAAHHHALANHPDVVAALGRAPSLADSRAVVERQAAALARNGFCFWVAERRADGRFVGWCGLQPGEPPIEGGVEIGWAISPDLWRQGLAREAAEAVLGWA